MPELTLYQFKDAVWNRIGRHRVLYLTDVKSVNDAIKQCHELHYSIEDAVDEIGLTEHVSPFFSERMACDAMARIASKYRESDFTRWQKTRIFSDDLGPSTDCPGFVYEGGHFIVLTSESEFGVLTGNVYSECYSLDDAERMLWEHIKHDPST